MASWKIGGCTCPSMLSALQRCRTVEATLEKVLYNADDRPIQRVLFIYDDSGRLMEEGEAYDDNGIRDDFRNVFRYDAQGRCIEREMHCPFGSERQTTTYNEYGDVSETRRIPLTTDFDLLPQDSWARYFTYEYDDPGNWITCHEELRVLDTGKTTYREEKHDPASIRRTPVQAAIRSHSTATGVL